MRHTKEIKRPDGSKVRITAILRCDYMLRSCEYRLEVEKSEPRKRTWRSAVNHDDYKWRGLNAEDRKKEDLRRQLTVITADEAQSVALELWEMARPDFLGNAEVRHGAKDARPD